MRRLLKDLQPVATLDAAADLDENDKKLDEVIEPNKSARLLSKDGGEQMTVNWYRYTPQGWRYDLVTAPGAPKRRVPATALQPLYGETRVLRVNLMTGEEDTES